MWESSFSSSKFSLQRVHQSIPPFWKHLHVNVSTVKLSKLLLTARLKSSRWQREHDLFLPILHMLDRTNISSQWKQRKYFYHCFYLQFGSAQTLSKVCYGGVIDIKGRVECLGMSSVLKAGAVFSPNMPYAPTFQVVSSKSPQVVAEPRYNEIRNAMDYLV